MLRMPAEWERHEATWLAWPYDPITFPNRVQKVEKIFEQIIEALAPGEQVNLLVRDQNQHSNILKNVRMLEADYADVWTRDYMPSFVIDNHAVKAVKWIYDAYSQKFPDLLKDNEVFDKLAVKFKIESINPGIVLEGGAIEANGKGTLLTTDQCLLARNAGLSKERYEEYFREYLGIAKVIWLKKGIANDHTDGHIDAVARFTGPDTIICTLPDAYETLQNATDPSGRKFKVIMLPLPNFRYPDGRKAPASYANFYIGNGVVLVPQFGDPHDSAAFEILQPLFPGRKMIRIDSRDLIYGGGGIHCITREQPML